MPLSITTIDHVNLSVRDLHATAQWYNQVLGLAVLRQAQADMFERAILGSGHGRPVFGLTEHRANTGQPFSETSTGMDHLAFAVACHDELRAWSDHFDKVGLAYNSPNERLLVVRDPDNIQVELSCR